VGAQDNGGIVYVAHADMTVTLDSIFAIDCYAGTAAFAYVPDSSAFSVTDSVFNYLYSSSTDTTTLMHYTANGALAIDSCTFKSNSTYTIDDITEAIEASVNTYLTGFYISSSSLIVTLTSNYFQNFNFAKYGGVFYIDQATVTDDSSEYIENSALQGGAIYCQFCTLTLQYCLFKENNAKRGGAVVI